MPAEPQFAVLGDRSGMRDMGLREDGEQLIRQSGTPDSMDVNGRRPQNQILAIPAGGRSNSATTTEAEAFNAICHLRSCRQRSKHGRNFCCVISNLLSTFFNSSFEHLLPLVYQFRFRLRINNFRSVSI